GQFIARTLLGSTPDVAGAVTDSVRATVMDKNELWFRKYRASSGNDVWGSRSVQDGNYATLQRELEMLDVLAQNRDRKIWARAQGEDLELDDSNVPDPLIV